MNVPKLHELQNIGAIKPGAPLTIAVHVGGGGGGGERCPCFLAYMGPRTPTSLIYTCS